MARLGFIHDSLDIKILILYILARLETPIDLDTLADLTLCDEGISYFDFSECTRDLIKTEHLQEENGLLSITEKGLRNGRLTESSLPYSIREQATQKTAALSRVQRRNAMIKAEVCPHQSGEYSVKLALSDGLGEVLNLELYAATVTQAEAMANTFQKNAEQFYSQIVSTLLDESVEKDSNN